VKIKVDAIGTIASDSLEKPLKVIPEGIPKTITQSVLIMKNDSSSTYSSSLQCILPPTAVTDTTSAFASVAGDLLGPMLSGIENLIQMSYGCGEQNLLNFVPSIVALRYLETTGQLTAALRAKAIGFAEAGYQLELTYRRTDGSFSAFGNNDQIGSTWLSAFAVDAFEMASTYITIDSNVVKSAYDYFVSKQNPDGSFREDGNVIHKDMQGGSSKGLPLTAFVSIVLSRNIAKLPEFIPARDKALNYIANNLDKTDVYALCISALALHLGNHAGFASVYADMIASGIETADQLSWSKPVPVSPDPNPWWYSYQQKSVDIEMTAYALQVLADKDIAKAVKVAKNLVSRKNAYGGYGSTQDTVQALFSLSVFGVKFHATAGTIDIRLTPDIGTVINSQVNPSNLLVVQEYTLNPLARSLAVYSGVNSVGSAIVTLTCKFYEVSAELAPRFNIRTNLIRPCKTFLKQEVCISYIPKGDDIESNMALMKMTLPSGYVYDEGQQISAAIKVGT
jgi:CD109 antigen